MSRRGGAWSGTGLLGALVNLLSALGVAFGAGALVVAVVPPGWTAAGLPYVLGYGKNVEALAFGGGIAAAVAARFLARWSPGRLAVVLAALAGWATVGPRLNLAALQPAWSRLAAVAALSAGFAFVARVEVRAAPPADDRIPRLAAAGAVVALALVEGLLACRSPFLDVFHQGEVLASATDWLAGGRPFATFLWPHGLSDTGLAAAWIALLDKSGTSPVFLAQATTAALGVVAAYLLARRLSASRLEALVVAAVLVARPLFVLAAGVRTGSAALASLGGLLFVVLSFSCLRPERPRALLAAGLWLALAHLFRLETAVYGVAAAIVAIAVAALAERRAPFGARLAKAAISSAWLATGLLATLLVTGLLFGLPNREWIEYLFGELARHHRDAVGLVLAWPLEGLADGANDPLALARAIAWILLTLGLAIAAARELALLGRDDERRAPLELLFIASFAFFASRSVLDRSDGSHVAQWTALPILAALLLLLGRLRERFAWSARRAALVAAATLLLVDAQDLRPIQPDRLDLLGIAPRIAAAAATAAEHVAGNPPAGECADRSFTPRELTRPDVRAFVAATCTVERLLDRESVSSLAIADSAAWYWVRFGMPVPYREFSLSRAYTPVEQRRFIERERSRPLDALLLPVGFGGMRRFDVPGPVRVPVIEAYLRARREGVPPTPTPIGDLFLWNRPAPCPPALGPVSDDGSDSALDDPIDLVVETFYYAPESGLLYADGAARERASGAPLAALVLPPQDGLELGAIDHSLRALAAPDPPDPPNTPRDRWELFALLSTAAPPGAIAIDLRRADGRVVRRALELAGARRLGPLRGAAWRDLDVEIANAWRLGRETRLATAGAGCAP